METLRTANRFVLGKSYEGTGEVRGVYFTLEKRKGNLAIFHRSDGLWEVIQIKEQKTTSKVIDGIEVEFKEKEVYPSGNSWVGKCVTSRAKAEEHFEYFLKNKSWQR